MTVDEKARVFTSLIEEMHKNIEPLKSETQVIECAIGFKNKELAGLSIGIIRQLDALQNSYLEQILNKQSVEGVHALLKEFEEAFYNAVLDYRNSLMHLQNTRMNKAV